MTARPFPRLSQSDAILPAGEYLAKLVGYETRLFFGRSAKVVMTFEVMDTGPYFQMPVRGFYAVRRLVGKARRSGQFEIGIASRLARDMARMLAAVPPLDRVPMDRLQNGLYRVKCRLVDRDYDQQEIPDPVRYAVVDHVVGRE